MHLRILLLICCLCSVNILAQNANQKTTGQKSPVSANQTPDELLKQLNAATTLDFLRVPPGNRLEQLSGNREGQWSIRINDQWRLSFRWLDGTAADVEIVDYH